MLMASTSASLTESLFCDHCGLQFELKQPVCAGCGAIPTRQWFQLMSLVTLLLAVGCNSAVGWFVLPRLVHARRAGALFRAWLLVDEKGSVYGWMPIILGLLAWDFFIWRRTKMKGARPKIKRWLTKKLLTFVVVVSVTPLIPWWVPAGQPPNQFLSMIGKYPGLPSTLAWATVVLVLSLLCLNRQTRDSLLGHGRILSLISLGVLLVVLGVTLIGWSLTY